MALAAVRLFLRNSYRRVYIGDVRRDYDEYRGPNVNPKPASRVDMDTLFDRDP